MVHELLILGTRPVDINCPECHDDIRTVIIYRPERPSCCTSLCALCICCLCWPCICLQICCHICLTGIHSCPNCNAQIGQSEGHRPPRPRASLGRNTQQ